MPASISDTQEHLILSRFIQVWALHAHCQYDVFPRLKFLFPGVQKALAAWFQDMERKRRLLFYLERQVDPEK